MQIEGCMSDNKPIMAIEILYTSQTAIEKEILKEFFRFIGCLVKTERMSPESILKKQKALANRENNQIAHLFLTKQFPAKIIQNEIWCDFSISSRKLAVNGKTIQYSSTNDDSVTRFEKEALDTIIDNIWQDNKNDKGSLLHINAAFWQFNMFAYLQIKSTFQALKIGELKAIGMRNDYKLPDNDYLNDMANAFVEIEKQCREETQSVYSVYSCVNAQRHLRELYTAMEIYSQQRIKLASVVKPVGELLAELNKIYRVESDFVSMYCLAAALCKEDSQFALDEILYLCDARKNTPKELIPFTAEIFLRYGMAEKQVYADQEKAMQCFQKAIQLNESCYPAIFQSACLYAIDRNYKQAKSELKKAIIIIQGDDSNNDWSFLSLEEILYVFRSYIWLAKLALTEGGESAIGVPIAAAKNAAIAFMKAPILEKCNDLEYYRHAKEYHQGSITVRAVLTVLRYMTGNSEINRELQFEINNLIKI